MIKKSCFELLSIGLILSGIQISNSQEYPSKSIRIVTGSAGGGGDFAARMVAQGLTEGLGQQVVVDNRGGNLPAETVAKAAPDGYVLLLDGGSFWIGSLLAKTSYDPVADFSAVSTTTTSPLVVVIHPSLPVRSIKELIALARSRPGELNYASGATGAFTHLAPELFKAMAKVNIVRIPYKGGGPALNDLMGGQVQLAFFTSGSVSPQVKAGRLRALAVTSAKQSALLPDIPTVAASGLPGYEATSLNGIFAPARTPDTIIRRLNQEIVRVLNKPDVKERSLNSGVEAMGSSSEQFALAVNAELAKWGKLIRESGIRAE